MHFSKISKPFLEENKLINIRSEEEKAVNVERSNEGKKTQPKSKGWSRISVLNSTYTNLIKS